MIIENNLFIEKYRPKSFEEFVGGEEIEGLKKIRNEPFSLPHLLLVSKTPGTGKTSLAKIIIRELKADHLYLNASDERGIDVVRYKIKEFVMTVSMNRNAPKIVHLDEADGLTREAQDILRNLIEEYSANCRFILTANNLNKITEPLRSRCLVIQLTKPPKSKIYERLSYICKKENIEIDEEMLRKIVDAYYPDIRSMIKTLDEYKKFGTLNIEDTALVVKEIYKLIKAKKFTAARKLWLSKQIDYQTALKQLYEMIIEDEEIEKKKKKAAVYEIAEASYRMAVGADAEITFARCIFGLIGVGL